MYFTILCTLWNAYKMLPNAEMHLNHWSHIINLISLYIHKYLSTYTIDIIGKRNT